MHTRVRGAGRTPTGRWQACHPQPPKRECSGSQLRRTALTPAEPASIAGSLPPEARCQRPSVGGVWRWGCSQSWHLVSCSGCPELEDRAFHPCQLQGSLSCPAHHPPPSPCPALHLSGHSAPRGRLSRPWLLREPLMYLHLLGFFSVWCFCF